MENESRVIGSYPLTILAALGILAMLVLFVVSSLEMSLGAGLMRVAETWWGITTLVDLGAGVLVIAVWICLLERRLLICAGWIIGLLCLGNFTTLVYLLWRSIRHKTLRDAFLNQRSGDLRADDAP